MYKYRMIVFWTVFTGVITLLPFTNCSNEFDSFDYQNSTQGDKPPSPLDLARYKLFSETLGPKLAPYDSHGQLLSATDTRCTQCHGTMQAPMFATDDGFSNYKTILSNKLINYDDLENSKIIKKLRAGHQGFSETVIEDISSGLGDWVQAMIDEDLTLPDSPDGSGGGSPFPHFGEASPLSSLVKVKKLTTGFSLTESDISNLIDGDKINLVALKNQIELWMETPEFEKKMKKLMGLLLQQDSEYIITENERFIGRMTYTPRITENSLTIKEFYDRLGLMNSNIRESFQRTAVDIILNDRPFTEINTTQRWSVTSALLSLMAHSEKASDDPNEFDIPLGKRKKYAQLLQTQAIGEDDFSDWRWVNFKTISDRFLAPAFDDIDHFRGLQDEDEVKFADPKVGFFSTLAFKMRWPTNKDNQYRVFANQIMITALNQTFDLGDSTPQTIFEGIPESHAEVGSSCYSCHQRLDPMRNIFANNFTFDYRYRNPALSKTPSSFSFKGLQREISSLSEFGQALSDHPGFAKAWAEKLCSYMNSKPCSKDDPELKRIGQVFESSGFKFKTLFKEMVSSNLVTAAEITKTHQDTGDIVSISRRRHFCATLNTRLRDIQEKNKVDVLPDDMGVTLCGTGGARFTSPSIPDENNIRGDISASLPPTSSAISFQAVETTCRKIGLLHIKRNGAFDITGNDQNLHYRHLTEGLMGLPPSHPRHDLYMEALGDLYDYSRAEGLTHRDSLLEAFILACSSPELTGEGL